MIRYDLPKGFSNFNYNLWDEYSNPFDKFLSLSQDLATIKELGLNEHEAADELDISYRKFRFIKRRRVKDLKMAIAERCVVLYEEGYSKREIARVISRRYERYGYSISPQSVVNYIDEYESLAAAYERDYYYFENGFGSSVQKFLLGL